LIRFGVPVADDLVAPGFHNDGKRAGSFHLVSALLVLVSEDVAILANEVPDLVDT
jgi:hypothetical protein